MDLMRANWLAEGCVERVQAALSDTSPGLTSADWRALDSTLLRRVGSLNAGSCEFAAVAAGDRIDISSADSTVLSRVFATLGVQKHESEQLAAAALDWRDADSLQRAFGAEAQWYRDHSRVGPSNRPFQSVAELRLVRGADSVNGLETLVGPGGGRLTLTRTPSNVLRLLPGINDEGAQAIVRRRSRGGTALSLNELLATLSMPAQLTLLAHQERLMELITVEPDFWVVTAFVRHPRSNIMAAHEIKILREGVVVRVIRRRRWLAAQ